jgi:hypothetical protein
MPHPGASDPRPSALQSEEQEAIFPDPRAGARCRFDFTDMDDLGVTVAGVDLYRHLDCFR